MFKLHLNVLCYVIEKPKPVVIIEPDKPESVTARCKIPGNEDDWTYSWFTEGSSRPISTDKDFSMRTDVSHSSSNITCRGKKKSDGQKSEISDAVTLNVSCKSDPLHCRK